MATSDYIDPEQSQLLIGVAVDGSVHAMHVQYDDATMDTACGYRRMPVSVVLPCSCRPYYDRGSRVCCKCFPFAAMLDDIKR